MEGKNSNCVRILLVPETQDLYKWLLSTVTNISQDTATLLSQKFQLSLFWGAKGLTTCLTTEPH